MQHGDGDQRIPSPLVSDQARARAPACRLQTPAQSLVRGEPVATIVEYMSRLLEAFQM